MRKYIFCTLLALTGLLSHAQGIQQFPVFPDCQGMQGKELENCFNKQVQDFVFNNFKVPASLPADYNGSVIVLFEVTDKGSFVVQYVDSNNPEVTDESKRVFGLLPKVGPPTYSGNPTYAKYTIRFAIPLQDPAAVQTQQANQQSQAAIGVAAVKTKEARKIADNKELAELDSIVYKKFNNPQLESHLNIPFSHSYYAQFDMKVNQVGSNNHTGSKPFTYSEVAKYYDFAAEYEKIKKNKENWAGRKLWNENLVELQGEDYWFTVNAIFDLQIGKSNPSVLDYTYVNTRGIQFQGGLGEQINFTTTIFESQGRFTDYYNRYAESIKPSGGDPAIIPGIGIAKGFKTDAYDFPLAEANLSYTPSKIFNLQLGYSRNFIGDGYRSLLESDGASPYPFFKLNTTFWKIKYTNTYMWMKDVRPDVTVDRTYATKYMANHYLSWNVSKRINLGFFESVVWSNQNNRGFDATFINPIIFYRAVEFASSARSGNALLGLNAKYKWNNRLNFYGQLLMDEFSLNDIKAGDNSWKNKYGYQLGAKYFNAFNVDHLLLQLEYNHVRPYVYAHSDPLTNYAHNNQSVGHQWGGNFREFIAIARYHTGRYYADAKLTFGERGLDFDTEEDSFNYGGNIFKDYDENRPYDTNVRVGQGNSTNILIADLQAGYLVNPATNMKFFVSLIYRNFDPSQETLTTFKENTTWFSVGIRSDVFNWYFDY